MRLAIKVVGLILLGSCGLFGEIQPLFDLDRNAWDATDIVFTKIVDHKGTFEVTRVFKGELQVGTKLQLPNLAPQKGAARIKNYPTRKSSHNSRLEQIPAQPVGSVVVLFLCRTENGWEGSDATHSLQGSALWIDGGKLYGFAQFTNRGPSRLVQEVLEVFPGAVTNPPLTEGTLYIRTDYILRAKAAFDAISHENDPFLRAKWLKPYTSSDIWTARVESCKALKAAGAAGTAVLAELPTDTCRP